MRRLCCCRWRVILSSGLSSGGLCGFLGVLQLFRHAGRDIGELFDHRYGYVSGYIRDLLTGSASGFLGVIQQCHNGLLLGNSNVSHSTWRGASILSA